jgi:hypothetical protein
MADKKQFVRIAVEPRTYRQIAILAKVLTNNPKVTMYSLVGGLADEAWAQAKEKGLVTDAMLVAHWIGSQPKAKGKKK